MKIIIGYRMPLYLMLLFVLCSAPDILFGQKGLYFTNEANHNYAKVESLKSFLPGDNLYGLLLVTGKAGYSNNLSLEDFTIEQNGERFVPVTLRVSGSNISIRYKTPFASGISPKKKIGLLKLINETEIQNGFYFQVFPANGQPLNKEWVKWFGAIAEEFKKPEIEVVVGLNSQYVTGSFVLDLTKGPGIFSSWGSAYLDEQKRKKDSVMSVQKQKKDADSLADIAWMKERRLKADKTPIPEAKIKNPLLETMFLDYAEVNNNKVEFYKVFIYSDEPYRTEHEYMVKFVYKFKDDNSGICYMRPAKVRTENPLNEKEYIKEFTFFEQGSMQIITCSRVVPSK